MIVGGGFKALKSVWHYSREIGLFRLYRALRSKNACKACALGTGGQNGGTRNEAKGRIEFCNKNIQAQLSDNRETIPATLFFEKPIASLKKLSGGELEKLGRLGVTLYKAAGASHYQAMDTNQAMQLVSHRLKRLDAQRGFFYASGRSSNEAAFLMQLFARYYGTNNVNNCSYYCHQASGVALGNSIGTGTATVNFSDIEKSDCIFVIGANPASNHPRFLKSLIHCRRRGGRVVIVNPAKEPGLQRFASPGDWLSMVKGGEKIASDYYQPHLGGDLAWIQGVALALIQANKIHQEFVSAHTEEYESYRDVIQTLEWPVLEKSSGLTRNQMQAIANHVASSRNVIFTWSMGLTHHTHGVKNIEALASLALLSGHIGRPGAGLLPLRGHSNIQGTGSMGFTPTVKSAISSALESKLGLQLPDQAGLNTMECLLAASEGDMDYGIFLGGNIYAASPDAQFSESALNKIPFKCFINSSLNQSHLYGVDGEIVILPPRVRDEERQSTTQESMFNFVRLSDGGIERQAQLKSEVEMICNIASGVIDQSVFDFNDLLDHDKIRQLIAETIPGYDEIRNITKNRKEFHVDGRILHQPSFQTPSGKARFIAHAIEEANAAGNVRAAEFTLGTIRSEGQFNSIIYHEFDSYRGQNSRDVLLMNPSDMQRLKLQASQLVDVSSQSGSLNALKVMPFDVREGNVLTYYPEANVLVPKATDKRSGTPAFKSVRVCISILRN